MKIRTILFVSGMQGDQLFRNSKQCAAMHRSGLYTREQRKRSLCSTKAQRKQRNFAKAKKSRPKAAFGSALVT